MPRWLRSLIIGILICAAVCLGLYFGLWVMFIGGIVQVIEAIKDNPVSGMDIGIGIIRVIGAGVVGWATFIVISLITWLFAKITE